MELFEQHLEIEMISFAVVAYARACSSIINTYFIYNEATMYLLVHVFRLLDIFLAWLQINLLNRFMANKLIVHLDMQLYLLILYLYLFVLDCNKIKSYGDIGDHGAIQQVVGLNEGSCINKVCPKKSIHIHEYSIDSNIFHAGKTVSIIKHRYKTKMDKNITDDNSIIKLMHNQLFSILFEYYIIFLQILFYENSLSHDDLATDARLNYDNIVLKKNIDVSNTTYIILKNMHNGLFTRWLAWFIWFVKKELY